MLHRSLPHNRCFPRIGELLRYLREGHARVSLALVTRSPAAALRSALRSHQPDLRAAQREQATAISIMGQLAGGPPAVLAPGRLFHYSYDDMLNATSRRKMLFAYARWLGLLPAVLLPFALFTIWRFARRVVVEQHAVCGAAEPAGWQLLWPPLQLVAVLVCSVILIRMWSNRRPDSA